MRVAWAVPVVLAVACLVAGQVGSPRMGSLRGIPGKLMEWKAAPNSLAMGEAEGLGKNNGQKTT